MKSKKILILIVIALIVALFVNMMIIKSKQTNKIDMVSEKEIVNEINYTEEEKENIVVESKNIKYIYFIAETKGSMQSAQLKGAEKGKIECAKKHFESISNGSVKYGVVDSYEHLIDLVTGINKI